MIEISCPICGLGARYKVIYRENLPKEGANFSARKNPDHYHYQMVKCCNCGLFYSNPILKNEKINQLYDESKFEYEAEVKNLQDTYGYYLRKAGQIAPFKSRILEIGCGNGFFLEKALAMGYQEVVGVEPSREAILKAPIEIKDKIIHNIFKPEDFPENYFDVICFFQVIEHIVKVNEFLASCFRCLKKGGVLLGIAHNVDALFSKILKDKCPIINDEHIYVFNRNTLKQIFLKNNFQVLEVDSVSNIYSLNYWLKMAPLPIVFKNVIFKITDFIRLGDKKIKLRAGNIYIIAQKNYARE